MRGLVAEDERADGSACLAFDTAPETRALLDEYLGPGEDELVLRGHYLFQRLLRRGNLLFAGASFLRDEESLEIRVLFRESPRLGVRRGSQFELELAGRSPREVVLRAAPTEGLDPEPRLGFVLSVSQGEVIPVLAQHTFEPPDD